MLKNDFRILIATGIYPPDIGGPATYSKLLIEQLPKQGIQTEVLSFGSVRHLPKGISHLIYFLKLLKSSYGKDLIFAQDPVSVGFPAMLAAKIRRKKFVLKIVGDYAWEQFQVNQKKFTSLEDFQQEKFDFITELRRKIQKLVAKSADKIIVPSNYLKKIIQLWGIDSFKIKVIYNAVSFLKKAEVSQAEAKRKIGIQGKIILSIGRLVAWKGFDTLIKLMPDLLKQNQDLKLIILGQGPEKKKLNKLIQKLRLKDKVFLTGQINHQEIPIYFKAADLFVLNTGYEGLSHLLIEAMQLKIPIVTTRIGGNPELIQNGKNGILVDYNNQAQLRKAILGLLANSELQKKYIQNSLNELQKFSLENMIEKTIQHLTSNI